MAHKVFEAGYVLLQTLMLLLAAVAILGFITTGMRIGKRLMYIGWLLTLSIIVVGGLWLAWIFINQL